MGYLRLNDITGDFDLEIFYAGSNGKNTAGVSAGYFAMLAATVASLAKTWVAGSTAYTDDFGTWSTSWYSVSASKFPKGPRSGRRSKTARDVRTHRP